MRRMIRNGFCLIAALSTVAMTACSGNATLPAVPLAASELARNGVYGAPRSKYIYVADRTREKLLVYPAYVADPKPIRTLGRADGVVEIGGIAVDDSGNLYVANGAGADVLEFSSGAKSFVKKYTDGLNHPVNLTFAKQTLYVVNEEGHYPYGISSAVVEFPNDGKKARTLILDPSETFDPFHGVAVDDGGGVWTTTSRSHDVWPPPVGDCTTSLYNTALDFISSTLILIVPLKRNLQAWGLAIDGDTLAASDLCGSVQRYRIPAGRHRSSVAGTDEIPMYATISADHLVVVPCAGRETHGYVYVAGDSNAITIRNGLRGPIGAAAGP